MCPGTAARVLSSVSHWPNPDMFVTTLVNGTLIVLRRTTEQFICCLESQCIF
jgi:hypothetical protein